MKDEAVQLVFVILAIVVLAAAEEIVPSCFGQGLPFLLALVMVMSARVNLLSAVMTAVGAGAFEDALSSLMPLTAICFFAIAALLSRKEYFPRPFLLLLFPLFELWSGLCAIGSMGDVFARMCFSLPLGVAALGIVYPAVKLTAWKAGLDE